MRNDNIIDGLVLEFGVLRGRSLRQIALKFKDRKVYGFDAFEGLEEDWSSLHKKGDMSAQGKLPENMPENVEFVVGWIENTLPKFLQENKEKVAFIHIDTDTYTPAKCVLDNIKERLVVGSVILFDEYRGYDGYEEHEYKAFDEFKKENSRFKFTELNLNDPNVWIVSRNIANYGLKDILKSLFTRPFDVIKAAANRLFKPGSKEQPQAAFELVGIEGEEMTN